MNNHSDATAFVHRFEDLRSAGRRAEIWRGVCWAVVVATGGLIVLAAADYWLELTWAVRVAGLSTLVAATSIVALKGILLPWRWWSQPRTAVEVERRFPQLGQRVRTVVQFSGRTEGEVAAEGVASTLVAALVTDTADRTRPLDLDTLVPRGKLRIAAASAALSLLMLVGLVGWNRQWQLALQRTLLDNRPYTQMTVTPGDLLVDEGHEARVSVKLTGRADKQVIVYSRPADASDEAWSRMELSPEDAQRTEDDVLVYEAVWKDVGRPTEYLAVAGKLRSPTYQIDVRYPIAVKEFRATLTPPAYTGLETITVEGGDLDVVEGTSVCFDVQLDRPCAEASLLVSDPPYSHQPGVHQGAPEPVSLKAGGVHLETKLVFRQDKSYWLAVRGADGTEMAQRRYEVRVRKDRPPQVAFVEPADSLEVHPIAEVMMRIRADDDFGLSKTGIVFQVNNGPEQTLLLKNFPSATSGVAAELVTRAVLEEVLLLENYGLSPTQAVTYYAFVEDNFPGKPKRTETDLKFIDIRSFKRFYMIGGT